MVTRRKRPDPAAEQRRRDFDAAVADARVHLDDMRRPSTPSTVEPVDLDAAVQAVLDRREAEQVRSAAAAEVARLAHPEGGGCAYCGVSHCGRKAWTPGPGDSLRLTVQRGWESHGGRWVCAVCVDAYHRMLTQTDLDRRIEAIFDRLGGPIPFACYSHPERFEGVAIWHHEHPGAAPSMVRWAFLDLDRLRAEVDAAQNPPPPPDTRPRRRGKRCPTCRTTQKVVEVRTSEGPMAPGAAVAWTRDESGMYSWEVEHCLECTRRWYAAAGANVEGLS